MSEQAKVADPKDKADEVIDLAPLGSEIIRQENFIQLEAADRRPRSIARVKETVKDEIEAFPELAERLYYVIPYNQGRTKVEGPSIKLALILARNWGNCAAGSRIIDENDERGIVQGVFIDYGTNWRVTRELKANKIQWRKKDGFTKVNQRDFDVLLQASQSKAMRNAILAGIPDQLVQTAYNLSRQLAAKHVGGMTQGDRPLKARLEVALEKFRGLGATVEMLERHLKHPWEKTTDKELGELIGIWNALKDKQLSLREAFPVEEVREDVKSDHLKDKALFPEKAPEAKEDKGSK